MFCKHDWEKVSEVVLESAFEQMVNGRLTKCDGLNPIFFKKTHILIVKCTKCGKITKFTTNSI